MIRNPRALLAFAAVVVALLAVSVAAVSPGTVVFPIVGAIAVSGGVCSALLALSKRDGQWSNGKRAVAVTVVLVWLVVGVLALPISFAYAACIPCTDDNTPRVVVTVATFAGPFLLLLAAALPARRVVA